MSEIIDSKFPDASPAVHARLSEVVIADPDDRRANELLAAVLDTPTRVLTSAGYEHRYDQNIWIAMQGITFPYLLRRQEKSAQHSEAETAIHPCHRHVGHGNKKGHCSPWPLSELPLG